MIYIGIDPGPEESAVVVWDGESIVGYAEYPNPVLAATILINWGDDLKAPAPGKVAIEQIRGFGVPASNKLFDTCYWTGRFVERLGEENCILLPRKEVRKHFGAHNDTFVREALIERLGEPGTKKAPGPTYGMAGHLWAALAVSIAAYDVGSAA